MSIKPSIKKLLTAAMSVPVLLMASAGVAQAAEPVAFASLTSVDPAEAQHMDARQADATQRAQSSAETVVASAAESCGFVTAITVTKPHDSHVYTLDSKGRTVSGAPHVTASYCGGADPASSGSQFASSRVTKNPGQVLLTLTHPNSVNNGSPIDLSVQATFNGANPTAFGAKLTPDQYGMAVTTAGHTAARNVANCVYSKPAAPADYFTHYSCPTNSINKVYTMSGHVWFGLADGSVHDVYYAITYRLDDGCQNGC